MADPPWDIHMELPYGTLTDDEVRNLRIGDIHQELDAVPNNCYYCYYYCYYYIYIYIYIYTHIYTYNLYNIYNVPPLIRTPPNKKAPPPSKLIVPPSKLVVTIFASEGGVLMRGVIVPPSKLIVTIFVPPRGVSY